MTTYTIWPLTFTPSPGPKALYGDRPESRIASVVLVATLANGDEVDVGTFEADNEMALFRAVERAAYAHAHKHAAGPMVGRQSALPLTSNPPSIIARWTAERYPPLTEAQAREMSRNDNS